jgi:glucose/arabinose dehydrogenase
MAFDAAGNLIVADRGTNSIYRYPVSADGAIAPSASPPDPLIAGLDNPTSVAVQDVDGSIWLYVGEESQIVRYPYEAGGAVGAQEIVVPDLPVGGHSTRTVLFGPDGWLYVSVGSSCNICDETEPLRATVSRYRADGSEGEIIANGLRNAVGLAIQPGTETLWVTVNERDRQGDEIPPDLVTAITPGANYGWPDCLPPDATPQYDGAECEGVMPPTIGIQAHSAPLGLAFYQTSDGSGFPGEYAGDLFVVQHGSWNRSEPAPPRLLWIDMENGQPMAALDFATGWQDENGSRWGRPAGVIVAPDGSLLLTDDNAGLIYRITWTG